MTQWFWERGLFARRKERIEITVETRETWGVQWFRQSRSEICPICRAETIFIPQELGVQIVQVETSVIENLIKNEKVHFNETAENERLICLSSLKRSMEESSVRKFLKDG